MRLSVLGLIAFFATLAFPAFADQLPDELNTAKAGQRYQSVRSVSDRLRADAQNIQNRAERLDSRIQDLKSAISANMRDINQHERSIDTHNDDIRNFRAQNSALASEAANLRNRIEFNRRNIEGLERQESGLQRGLENQLSESRELGAKLKAIEHKISSLNGQIQSVEGQIERNKSETRSLLQSATDKEKNSAQWAAESKDKLRQAAAKEGTLQSLKSSLGSAQSNADRTAREVEGKKMDYATAKSDAASAKAALDREEDKLDTLKEKVRTTQSDFDRNNAALDKLHSKHASNETELEDKKDKLQRAKALDSKPTVQALINRLEGEIRDLENKKRQIKSDIDATEEKVRNADRAFKSAKSDLADAEARIKPLKDDYAAKKSKAASAESDLTRAQSADQSAQAKVSQIKSSITETQNDINDAKAAAASLDTKSDNAKREAGEKRAQASRMQSELSGLESNLSRMESQMRGYENEKSPLDRELDKVTDNIRTLRGKLSPIQTEIANLRNENNRFAGIVNANVVQISQNEYGIGQRETWKQQLSGQIASLERSNLDFAREQADKEDESRETWSDYRTADSKARSAEGDTASVLAQYQAVQARYRALMDDAQAKGGNAGRPLGEADGARQGKLDGAASGKQLGELNGKSEGLQYGLDSGIAEGERKGHGEGYAHGKNSPQNHAQGHAAGVIQGQKDAVTTAQAEDYPAARAAVRKAKTALSPAKAITVDNQAASASAQAPSISQVALGSRDPELVIKALEQARGKEMNSNTLTAGTLVGNLSQQQADTKTGESTAAPMQFSGSVQRPDGGFESVFAATKVNMSANPCKEAYADFTQGCVEAYQAAYMQAFAASYKAEHASAKAEAYQLAYDAAFTAHKSVRYQEGYDQAYPVAYAKWDAVGADEARATGYAQGKKSGYDASIAAARKAAVTAGENDENQLFASQSVIAMLDAKAVGLKSPTTFTAGDAIALQVRFANYGGAATQRGQVKITWESLSADVSTESVVSQVIGLPGQTTTTVNSVAFAKIGPNAATGAVHKMRVRATMPDGSTQESIVSITTQQRIVGETKMDYDYRPWIQGLFWSEKTHEVKVTVKNPTTQTAEKDIYVVLSSPNAAAVRIDVPRGKIGKLRGGEALYVILKYTLNTKATAGKSFPFTVTTYYGDDETGKKDFSVLPQ